jgi:hypothetical protein
MKGVNNRISWYLPDVNLSVALSTKLSNLADWDLLDGVETCKGENK